VTSVRRAEPQVGDTTYSDHCRAVGLGASLQTLPIWVVPIAQRILGLPRKMVPVCVIPIGWAKGNYGPTT
jgi:hypothetical protein